MAGEVLKQQGHEIGAVTVLAPLDQAAQPAPEQRELPDLLVDCPELGLGRADDVVGGMSLGGPEQIADLPEREAQPPGPSDEGQPPPAALGVLPEAVTPPLRPHPQPPPPLHTPRPHPPP